jgi:hypothetical protein
LDVAFVLLAAIAVGLSVSVPPEALPALPLCPFRALTDLPCPGCGLTHAFCAIGHAEFVEAWRHNPFGFVFYAGALGLLAWPLLRRRCGGLLERLVASRWFVGGPLAVVAAMWAFGVWRVWLLRRG